MKSWPDEKPKDKSDVAVLRYDGKRYFGHFNEKLGLISSESIPDGYVFLTKGDKWTEL